MKGIKFIALGEISLEAKEKLKKLIINRKIKLEKLISDYRVK